MGLRRTIPRSVRAADYAQHHGVTFAAAGRRFRVSRQLVQRVWKERYGSTSAAPIAKQREARRARLAKLVRSGRTVTQIATELGLTHGGVRWLITKHGLKAS